MNFTNFMSFVFIGVYTFEVIKLLNWLILILTNSTISITKSNGVKATHLNCTEKYTLYINIPTEYTPYT